jgi:hypothetical protein
VHPTGGGGGTADDGGGHELAGVDAHLEQHALHGVDRARVDGEEWSGRRDRSPHRRSFAVESRPRTAGCCRTHRPRLAVEAELRSRPPVAHLSCSHAKKS